MVHLVLLWVSRYQLCDLQLYCDLSPTSKLHTKCCADTADYPSRTPQDPNPACFSQRRREKGMGQVSFNFASVELTLQVWSREGQA